MVVNHCMRHNIKSAVGWLKSKTLLSTGRVFIEGYSYTTRPSVTDEGIVRSPFEDIVIPKKTFTELIWERHEKWKNKKAVVCGLTGQEFTYSELKEQSTLIGKCLVNEGLCAGDVLAVQLPNSPKYISIILGASERGLTICSINPLYTADEITHQIRNSGAKKIITFPEKVNDVMKAVETLRSNKSLPPNFKVFCVDEFRKSNATPKNTISLNDLIYRLKVTNSSSTSSTIQGFPEKSLAFIAHSSGTTGLPKGVCLTHKNVTASILQMAHQPMSVFKETNGGQDVMPMVLPIFHNFGLEMTLCALYHGSKIVTLPKFQEATFLSTLEQATVLFVAPPTLLFMGSSNSVTEKHLKNLRCILTAAAPLGEEDVKRCLRKAPKDINFIQAYGQTEAMCTLTQTPYGTKNFKSVGIPVVNTKIKVVDLETGASKGPYEEGEFCFKGPQASLGYINNPEATNEAIDKDGWFHTGDIGYYDKEGFFYIVDRMKELIKVKGFQVAPAELESVLRSHPEIDEVGVIGAPNVRKGEVPVAFIKRKMGSKLDVKNVQEFLAGKVAPFKQVETCIFVDSIPISPSGKILRKELKKMYLSRD